MQHKFHSRMENKSERKHSETAKRKEIAAKGIFNEKSEFI